MTTRTQTFTVADPRTFDGNPFDVARRATAQAAALAKILETAIDQARLMARNAEMERKIMRDEDPDAAGWDETVEGKSYAQTQENLTDIQLRLKLLTTVAGFDPKAPLDTPVA